MFADLHGDGDEVMTHVDPRKGVNVMHRILAAVLVFSMGCGTILNGGPATLIPPPGATVDGVAGPISVSQKTAHEVTYQDGRPMRSVRLPMNGMMATATALPTTEIHR